MNHQHPTVVTNLKSHLIVIAMGLGVLAVPREAGAQGTVSFAGAVVNTNNIFLGTSGKISPASNYHFGLYLGVTAAAAHSSTTPALLITPAASAFAGQISSATLTIANHPTGETDFFVIKGWDGDAPTFEAAVGHVGYQYPSYANVSGVGQITTGLGGGSAPPFFLFTGPGGIGVNGLVLYEDPEPCTLVLSSLGIAALVFHFRRREICGQRKPGPMGK